MGRPRAPEHACATRMVDESKQRKKLQNRLNQRASRLRKLDRETSDTRPKPRQYQVDRWRLDEHRAVQSAHDASNSGIRPNLNQDASDQSFGGTWFPLPADHLLHLIKYNVFRGLWQNKAMLEHLAVRYRTAAHQVEAVSDHAVFPSHSVIMPATPHFLGCLAPTLSQMSIVHSTWIDVLPFPAMRENLIQWEFGFDHSELVQDLVGDLINLHMFLSDSTRSKPLLAGGQTMAQQDDIEPTATQTGLIIWGEPYLTDSWEATPQFLSKWGWAMSNCQGLIQSTNRWRELRGELPLRFSVEAAAA